MMERIFADTDVIIDLLGQREPFSRDAARLFSEADKGRITICVSSLSFSNVHYILSKALGKANARKKLSAFKTLVEVLPVNDKIVELALASDFSDFEDGLQYYTAVEHSVKLLTTRNLRDFKNAAITVLTPNQYLKSLTGN